MNKLSFNLLLGAWFAIAGGMQLQASELSLAQKIKGQAVFTSPIIWVGTSEPPESESEALSAALEMFRIEGSKAGLAALDAFVQAHPESRWTPSVRVHLAERYNAVGRYSGALQQWEAVWQQTKTAKDAEAQSIAARALAGWLKLTGSLGRKESMAVLLEEAEQRGLFATSYAPALRSSREALSVMNQRPGDAFRCGSVALAQLMKLQGVTNSVWRDIHKTPSPNGGFKLSELVALAAQNGFRVLPVQRSEGGKIPVPSVVHWKLDHYAAIVEQKEGRYKVVDPTFGVPKWLDQDTINSEASGAFLIVGEIPVGWKRLSDREGGKIYGKGYTQGIDDNGDNTGEDGSDDDCDPPDANDGPEGGGEPCPEDAGMPVWSISDPYMTLWIHDVPLYYRNARGGWEKLRLSYKQRALPRNDNVAGFGDGWECNWLGFLEQDSASPDTVKNYQAGGGILGFPANSTPEPLSNRRLNIGAYSAMISGPGAGGGGSSVRASGGGGGGAAVRNVGPPSGGRISQPSAPKASLNNHYGFAQSYGAGITRLFRTNQVDRYNRQLHYGFTVANVGGSDYVRLTNRVDKDGKFCTLAYTNTAFPRLITSVTDPYQRSAYFIYDHLGRLTNITDMAGLSSSFKYDADNSITNMITPYGTNSFRFFNRAGGPAYWGRGVEVTEPGGTKQLFTYHDGVDGNWNWHHMYTYHWDRKRYEALSVDGKADPMDGMSSEDFAIAPIKEWMRDDGSAYVANLVGRVYKQWDSVDPVLGQRTGYTLFNYPDQGMTAYNAIESIYQPDRITWAFYDKIETPRNSWGRPTEIRYYRTVDDVETVVSFTNIFNADGRRLEKVWGPNGEQVRGYGYDATRTNLLTSVTNALGEVIRYTYDAAARVTSITQPSGLVTTNIYYSSGDYTGFLKTRAEIGFRTNHYTWLNGNLEWHTNELGLATKQIWDKLNRLTAVLYPDGTTITNTYSNLDLVAEKDRLNQWTYSGYNRVQQLVARTNVNGQVTQWDYCGCGSPSEIIKWNGGTPLITQFAYNMGGRLTNVIYPDGYALNYEYDLAGRLAKVIDPNGLQLQMTYMDYDNLKTTTLYSWDYSLGGIISDLKYDLYGRVATATDRNGITITNAYDILGRLTNRGTIAANGYLSNTVAYAYTARGLTNSTDELGKKTWFVYDAAGRLLAQTNANNEVLQFTYNPADQMLTLKDGKDQQTSWNYDEYGRVTNKLDASSSVVFRYKYDPLDRLTNRWTAQKGDTFYGYDPLGNLTNVNYPGTVMDIVLKYDSLNRLTNVVDAIGTTKFTYTDAGQLVSEDGPWADDLINYSYTVRRRTGLTLSQPNASPWEQSYGYDGIARLSSITSPAGTFTHSYLSAVSDRLYELYLPDTSANKFIRKGYDQLARLTSTTLYASGNVVNQHDYEMNAAGQRTRQTINRGHTIHGYASSQAVDYTYDDIGQLKTAQGKDRVMNTSTWDYDEIPRQHEQFGYAYDKAWNLSHRTNNALTQTFSVDSKNQLTSATRSGTLTVAGQATGPRGGDSGWGYPHGVTNVTVSGTGLTTGSALLYADGAWAKTNATLANGNNTYTATAKDTYDRTATDSLTLNLPTTINFQYDGNGNLTNDGRRVFEYDYENQLTNVYVASAWKSEFKYDAFGRKRTQKDYGWAGSAWSLTNETRYVYDGMLVIQERNANNVALVSYTRGNDLSGSLQGAGGIGGLLARTDNSQLLSADSTAAHAYYHADGNGNITALVNTNGAALARYTYDPYGNLLGSSGPLAEANTYRFSSKEWHGSVGVYHYGYRFYDPNLQRWLNQDPLGDMYSLPITVGMSPGDNFDDKVESTSGEMLVGSLSVWLENNINLQRMTGNNPISQIDLLGLASCKIDGERVQVHKNDVDPWPSRPHGHIYDKNQVVDNEGNIYNKTTRQTVGRFSRSGLARWRDFLGKLRGVIFGPVIGLIENLGADAERSKRARENGKSIEQQRREDLRNQPTIPGFFGEPLPNPYYCPTAILFPSDRVTTNKLFLEGVIVFSEPVFSQFNPVK